MNSITAFRALLVLVGAARCLNRSSAMSLGGANRLYAHSGKINLCKFRALANNPKR